MVSYLTHSNKEKGVYDLPAKPSIDIVFNPFSFRNPGRRLGCSTLVFSKNGLAYC